MEAVQQMMRINDFPVLDTALRSFILSILVTLLKLQVSDCLL